MKVNIIVFISFFLISCGKSSDLPQKIKTIDVLTKDIEDEIELLDFFETKFTVLETSFESAIRRIDRIVKVDSNFLIEDESENKVFLFNSEGSLIKSLNPVGKPGPGEFNMVIDIEYNDDTVFLNDFRRVLMFDKNLGWMKTQKLFKPVNRICHIKGKAFCFSNNQFSDPVRIFKYEKGFSSEPEVMMTEYRKMGRLRMHQNLNLLKFEDHALLSIFHMDTIYSIQDQEIIPKYRINFVDREFATNYFDNIPINYDTDLLLDNLNRTKLAHNIYDFIEHEEFFFFIFILDGKGVYYFKFKESGEAVLSHNLKLDGIRIGVRLNGFYNGRAFFTLEPHEISNRIRSQYRIFENGFDEYSNPVIMELSLRDESREMRIH